jgi:hypothetical protein
MSQMSDARVSVLIGDFEPERYELLTGILDDEFRVKIVWVRTYDQLKDEIHKARTAGREWKLVLIAHDLPYSYDQRQSFLARYFPFLEDTIIGTSTGCIVGPTPPTDLLGINPQPHHIHIPSVNPTVEEREQTITELSSVLWRAPRPPQIILASSPPLREQVRSLSESRNLEDGKKQLGHLVRDFFDCDTVEVDGLGQGLSGAAVFRIRPQKVGEVNGEFILKLSSDTSLWKIKLEIIRHAEVKGSIGVENYRVHIADLKEPRFPHDPDDPALKYAVSYYRWYAICYDFLGGERFGKFIDLETALTTAPDKLVEKLHGTIYPVESTDVAQVAQARGLVLKTLLNWLCKNLYQKGSGTSRETRLIWDTEDSPDRQYVSMPPYKLTGKTKGWILNFLDSNDGELGERFFPDWKECHQKVWQLVEQTGGSTGVALLDTRLLVLLSPVHGDLNANNILLWLESPDHPFLIDFPFYQQSAHAIQDLARLEAEIKFALMDRQGGSTAEELLAFDYTASQIFLWQDMEDILLSDEWQSREINPDIAGYKPNVELCLNLIKIIRSKALETQQQVVGTQVGPAFLDEYLPALLYHTIRSIGYPSLSVFKRLLAVHSAGSILGRR